ncbi:hypothetical protein H6762_00980 [Candidatus Nomurabacteria bacterium]|uniref:Uncharacterized protein n=1 Tax=Candidatus Dojkabacteria bacterium TaxID=2099670 RepID=A0A955KXG8_9BACT|nr:hypothetical protein [Candidatus Dojkabacteria bacterium]MCB9789551.1 hypothetical protein [Candidatus Nomurabacteria bacterium]
MIDREQKVLTQIQYIDRRAYGDDKTIGKMLLKLHLGYDWSGGDVQDFNRKSRPT